MEVQEMSFKEFKFNPEAKYDLPIKWNKTLNVEEINHLKIFVNATDSFQARNLNIFTNYTLTFYNANVVEKWLSSCNMTFYQNQLNFAIWCSSAGCGISVNEHILTKNNLLSSVYRFHIYYQTRKLLEEMECPIPGESIFKEDDNKINMIKYQKLCNEFGVPTNTDFRYKGGENGGLGTMFNYASRIGYVPKHVAYNPKRFQFNVKTTNEVERIDYIFQESAIDGWKQFLLEHSNGFSKAGVIRLDDSIRTYVYCVLGSQAQTRANIVASLETQQYFVNLLEKNISSMFSIPESIGQYENSITNTNSRINFVVGYGLYMMPSELVLKIGTIEKYNNHIIIAKEDSKIGLNENLNSKSEALTNINKLPIKVEPLPDKRTLPIVQINKLYLGIGFSALVFLVSRVFLGKSILK